MSGYFDALNRRAQRSAIGLGESPGAPTPPDTTGPDRGEASDGFDASREALAPAPYAALREKLLVTANGKPLKTLVFAGCTGGEGCTRVLREFAATLARSGSNVLVIDADLRTSGAAASMAPRGADLMELMRAGRRAPASRCGRGQLTVVSNPASAPGKEHVFGTPEFATWLDGQRSAYDYVLLDAPPLLRFADGTLIGRLSDGAVIVVQAEATQREALVRAREQLQRAGVNVVGVVLNRARNPVPAALRPYLSIE
jgi:Mrp family chromosome partitioning ATPase